MRGAAKGGVCHTRACTGSVVATTTSGPPRLMGPIVPTACVRHTCARARLSQADERQQGFSFCAPHHAVQGRPRRPRRLRLVCARASTRMRQRAQGVARRRRRRGRMSACCDTDTRNPRGATRVRGRKGTRAPLRGAAPAAATAGARVTRCSVWPSWTSRPASVSGSPDAEASCKTRPRNMRRCCATGTDDSTARRSRNSDSSSCQWA